MTKFSRILIFISVLLLISCSQVQNIQSEDDVISALNILAKNNEEIVFEICHIANNYDLSSFQHQKVNSLKNRISETYCSNYVNKFTTNFRNTNQRIFIDNDNQLILNDDLHVHLRDSTISEYNEIYIDILYTFEIIELTSNNCKFNMSVWDVTDYDNNDVDKTLFSVQTHTAYYENNQWRLDTMFGMYEGDLIY
jgi:hypothetical protein